MPGLSEGVSAAVVAMGPLSLGLGLFFSGVRFVATGLAALVGKALGGLLGWAVRRPGGAVLAGILGGLLTQGTTAVILVVIGLMRSGEVRDRRAVLVTAWSHVGAAALVLLVAVDLRLIVSYALGAAGFAMYFDLDGGRRSRHGVQVLLGAGLLFLGVDLINSGVGPLEEELVRNGVLGLVARYPALLIGLGLVLSVATQSSTVASAIAVTAARAGLLDADQAVLMILGANAGAASSYLVLSRRGVVEVRRVMLLQAVQKGLGTAVLAAVLLAAGVLAGPQGPMEFLARVSQLPAGQLAVVFLLTQLAGSSGVTLVFRQLDRWALRRIPPNPEEALGQPAFLMQEALATPSLALDLVAREEERLAARLPGMLDGLRADGAGSPVLATGTLRQAGAALGQAIARYLEALMDGQPSRAEVARAMRLEDAVQNLVALHETLDEFAAGVAVVREGGPVLTADHMVEALHVLMAVLADAVASRDPDELALAGQLLGDRDRIMGEIRERLVDSGPADTPRLQAALLRATVCFERAVWLGRRCAVLAA